MNEEQAETYAHRTNRLVDMLLLQLHAFDASPKEATGALCAILSSMLVLDDENLGIICELLKSTKEIMADE